MTQDAKRKGDKRSNVGREFGLDLETRKPPKRKEPAKSKDGGENDTASG